VRQRILGDIASYELGGLPFTIPGVLNLVREALPQELETARRLGAGYTVVVFNDDDYGLISWKQDMSRERSTGTRISNPDFLAYAESFGVRAYRPRSVDELRAALDEAIRSRELRLIEVPVDPSVNRAPVEKLARYWDGKG
jgi:thiamine pyrophosphate-dependent acetolactate synthase large subunit-like protein